MMVTKGKVNTVTNFRNATILMIILETLQDTIRAGIVKAASKAGLDARMPLILCAQHMIIAKTTATAIYIGFDVNIAID